MAKNSSAAATAPYNFVSLPEKILPAEFANVADFGEHINAAGNISGEISLAIETLTPLFIGCGTKNFAPVDKPIIPGSSLRGMFKNIFKIVTCGAFRGQTESQRKGEDFNDEHIYYRCLMGVGRYPWTKDLNNFYKKRMTRFERGKPVKKARPGFLICTTDNKFFIAPSKSDRNRYGVNLFTDKGIAAFGHGQCFRIPYRKKIGAAVDKALQSEKIIDFADAVFGKEKMTSDCVKVACSAQRFGV